MSMTWKQLKDGIDKRLAEKGIPEDTEIWYFDFSRPDNLEGHGMDGIVVFLNKDMGICVS